MTTSLRARVRLAGILAGWIGLVTGAAAGQGLERVDPETVVPSVTVDELARSLEGEGAPVLIDVRLREDLEADPVLIEAASWKDPNALEDWAAGISSGTEVVVYCVRGAWVSQSVTKKLRDLGLSVSQLDGGIEAWKRAGRATKARANP